MIHVSKPLTVTDFKLTSEKFLMLKCKIVNERS